MAFTLSPALAVAAAPKAQQQAPGYYVTPVGDYQVIAVLDRTMQMPADQILVGATPEQIRAWLAARARPVPTPVSLNTFLINTGSELLLVDSGGGELLGPATALLQPTLHSAGYQAGQVGKVLLTHLHGDHVGGLSHNGQARFENAELWVPQVELDYWLSDEQRSKVPEGKRLAFDRARQAIAPYQKADRLRPFQWGDEVATGVVAVDMSGHTPGHTGFDVRSKGDRLLIWGDIVHVQDVQFDHPEVSTAFDVDAEVAKQRRLAAFQDAANHGYRVAGMHLAFPGLGHVRAKGAAYEWIPEYFTTEIN